MAAKCTQILCLKNATRWMESTTFVEIELLNWLQHSFSAPKWQQGHSDATTRWWQSITHFNKVQWHQDAHKVVGKKKNEVEVISTYFRKWWKKALLLCNWCSLTDFYIVFGIKLPQDGSKASLWLLSSPSTHSNITGWHRNVARWWPNASFVQMKLFNSPAELSGTTMSQDSCKALLLSNGLCSTHLNQILWRHDFSTT